ncbi:unnamed protein product, partial [Ectocarpus sp. 12 AP-2014]
WKEVALESGLERHRKLLGVEIRGRTARGSLPYPSTGGPKACLPLLLFGGRQGGGSARRKSSTSIRRWQSACRLRHYVLDQSWWNGRLDSK